MARLDADEIRLGVDEVVPHSHELEDPRSTVNLRHPLVSVVVRTCDRPASTRYAEPVTVRAAPRKVMEMGIGF